MVDAVLMLQFCNHKPTLWKRACSYRYLALGTAVGIKSPRLLTTTFHLKKLVCVPVKVVALNASALQSLSLTYVSPVGGCPTPSYMYVKRRCHV